MKNGKSELENAFTNLVNQCSTFGGFKNQENDVGSTDENALRLEMAARILGTTPLEGLFQLQMEFQKLVTGEDTLPQDNPNWYSYHMLAMLEELGEVLKADKRWKTHRNTRFVPEEKLDEIADIFITVMNICIFSNIDSSKLVQAVSDKIEENTKKLNGLMSKEML